VGLAPRKYVTAASTTNAAVKMLSCTDSETATATKMMATPSIPIARTKNWTPDET
jgi:hypothetical protein